MSGLLPTAVYGLEVPAGTEPIPSQTNDFPGSYRITMAAIDPSAEPIHPADMPYDAPSRATLKLIRIPIDEDEEDESEDDDRMDALLNGDLSDETSDNEANGGPSDPSKSKKAKREAGIQALKAALGNLDDEEEDMGGLQASKLNKGKGVASGDEEDEDSEEGDDTGMDEFVICTLDPSRNYQQPLDITIGERESVYFKVTGTHTVYLTGNYIVPFDQDASDEEEEDLYDLSPDEDEIYGQDDESDELDDLADPRITEIETDEDEVPKLVAANGTGKKRAAEDMGLDEMIKSDKKESVKQKKQKNNAGEAVSARTSKEDAKKSDKKVQFAQNLEQGPTPSGNTNKPQKSTESKRTEQKKDVNKQQSGTRTVQGVFVDDRKEGTGPAARKGQKIAMRYIGKFSDGKIFDSNKKGKPFAFTLGAGEVIKGWDIGVEGMRVGGERRIKVPSNLAYGSRPPPGMPKNAELTFDLKIVEIR